MKTVKIDPTLMDEDKYAENHIEECAECLMKAEDIQKDAKLMEKIQEYLSKKKDKISSLEALKEKANNFWKK
jgi:hypothetical protein